MGAALKKKTLSTTQRLKNIARIIEDVDDRCLTADGPVSDTREEMTAGEMRHIYKLANGEATGLPTIAMRVFLMSEIANKKTFNQENPCTLAEAMSSLNQMPTGVLNDLLKRRIKRFIPTTTQRTEVRLELWALMKKEGRDAPCEDYT